MAELKKKFTTKTILENIKTEKGWEITANTLLNLLFMRGSKTLVPLLGIGEGVIAPVMGWEKFKEVNNKVFNDVNNKLLHWIKETYNIPVEDAIGAAELLYVWNDLQHGPNNETEFVELTPEKVIVRYLKCAWWEKYKEFKIKPELSLCEPVHHLLSDEGLKSINHKITRRLTKSMPRGDPYCEDVCEFSDK
jgi:hypothetical protein